MSAPGCLAFEEVPDLREIGLGAWEGITVDEVRRAFPATRRPGAEILPGFSRRGERVLPIFFTGPGPPSSVATGNDARVAIVAHAGVNRVLLCRILGMPLGHLFRLEQDYGYINTVRHDISGYRVENINFCFRQSPSWP